MSDDTIRTSGPTRPYEVYGVGDLQGEQRRFGNPLTKGLLVLVMLALATTIMVATDDGEEAIVVAGDAMASAPLGPVTDEVIPTPSSVQEVASETARSEALSWADEQAQVPEYSWAAERLRQQDLGQVATTTTEAPTTAPPATAAPATTVAPPTTEAPSTSEAAPTDSTDTTDPSAAESTTTVAPETTEAPTTTAAPETTTTATGDGWVDTGNGVLVPPVLLAIRWCESRDDYQAANPSSSARGGYQFLTGSWAAYGHADRYGVTQAHLATKAQQDEAALLTWERDGTRPWNASKTCWSQRI